MNAPTVNRSPQFGRASSSFRVQHCPLAEVRWDIQYTRYIDWALTVSEAFGFGTESPCPFDTDRDFTFVRSYYFGP